MRRRLSLALAATFDRPFALEPAAVAAPPSWRDRLLRRGPVPASGDASALAGTDGLVLRLPATLDDAAGDALLRYRVLAHAQAERVVRGTASHAPPAVDPAGRLARDLYLLCEGRAVDRRVAARGGALARGLAALRRDALARRPALDRLTALERAVEERVRRALATDLDPSADDVSPDLASPYVVAPDDATPAQSQQWALRTATALLADAAAAGRGPGGYRGLAPVLAWGTLDGGPDVAPADAPPRPGDVRGLPSPVPLELGLLRGLRPREARPGERADVRVADPDAPTDPASETVDDARGTPTSDAGESAATRAPGRARAARPPDDVDPALPGAREYPEWDAGAHRLVARAVRVVVPAPVEGGEAWAARALGEHAAVARRVRERFARLRARRQRLLRQQDGAELDLDACVRALVARRTGEPPDDRLYVAVRPARRAVAFAVLVDVSGSTEAPASPRHQVIDVEKHAALLAAEALDALGDPFTLLAFSSYGARHVEVATLKAFGEAHGPRTRGRIGALRPGGNTRLGAALRHAAALLAGQPAGHRLLLVVSDGRPNDADGYTGNAAVEDSRQAVLEARAAGIVPFCLTIDREAPAYVASVFGTTGYAVLRDPERLPDALVGAVRQLLRG